MMVVIPDGGRSYLSKIYSDGWMRQYGFLERGADLTVGDVLRRKREAGEIPPLVTVEPHFRVRDAVALLHEHRVSQLPVVSATDNSRWSAPSASGGCQGRRAGPGPARRRDRRCDGALFHQSPATTRCGRPWSCWPVTPRRCWSLTRGMPRLVTRTDLLEALAT